MKAKIKVGTPTLDEVQVLFERYRDLQREKKLAMNEYDEMAAALHPKRDVLGDLGRKTRDAWDSYTSAFNAWAVSQVKRGDV